MVVALEKRELPGEMRAPVPGGLTKVAALLEKPP